MQRKSGVSDKVVSAARKLFAKRGFHQTAMADLAKEADVSVGAIYRVFPSKQDIIHAIIEADTARVLGELTHDVSRIRSGEATVGAVLEDIMVRGSVDKDKALIHEVLAEGHRSVQVAEAISEIYVHYRAMFREMAVFANPDLSEEELSGAEDLLLACLFSTGHRELTSCRLGARESARTVTRLIMRGLGSSE
ncbi:TetR family transcriptional regulator [Novosphingobium pentaromativorans US6-1]|nr:TetR family transcriptional regulator [Novosphingobium pentaromativorans US6-1]